MLALKTLQNYFQNYVISDKSEIAKYIVQPQHDSIEVRLQIYATAYRCRLINTLKYDFPVFCRLIGDKSFEKIGSDYVDAYPSHNFSIRYFGNHFCEFLRNRPELQQDKYLCEMAEFEFALNNTCVSTDDPVLVTADLAAIDPEQWGNLLFTVHSSLQLVNLTSNVPAMWHANSTSADMPEVEYGEAKTWNLWRLGVQSYYSVNTEHQALVLDLLRHGKTFAEVCEALCALLPEEEVPQQVAGFLLRWINEGIISSATLKSNE